MQQLSLGIFFESSTSVIFFLMAFYFVGVAYKALVQYFFKLSYSSGLFKNIVYGILITVYMYALLNSGFALNSVTITIAPILIFLFERYTLVSANHDSKHGYQVAKRSFGSIPFSLINKMESSLSILFILLFLFFNFYFHFHGQQINTGYGDQGWYHSVATTLQAQGIETINIHITPQNLRPGFIYHYWDLWMQAFFYHAYSFLNILGLFRGTNQFEISVLVFQPLLVLTIFLGVKELVLKAWATNWRLGPIYLGCLTVAIAAIGVCHNFTEFGIIHHPKQFIIAALFLVICLSITEGSKDSLSYCIFSPFFLFYYPLPGTVIILTLLVYILISKGPFNALRSKRFWIVNMGLIIVFGCFYYLYFIHGTTCYNNLSKTYKSEVWTFVGAFSRLFIYHGYHILKSSVGLILVLNIILLLLGKNKNYVGSGNVKMLLILALSNYVVGHLISSVLYTAPEEFQFYNNDFFSLTIIIVIDLIILYQLVSYAQYKLIHILYILLLFSFGGLALHKSYYGRPTYYNSIVLNQNTYSNIKKLKSFSCLETNSRANIPFATTDIVFSFLDARAYYNYDRCKELMSKTNLDIFRTSNCTRLDIMPGISAGENAMAVFVFETLGEKTNMNLSSIH